MIEPGGDKWWKADYMIVMEKAIPIYNVLRPNCKGVFQFDNSSNHGAYATEALRKNALAAGPGYGVSPLRETTWKGSNGLVHRQRFNYPSDCPLTVTRKVDKKITVVSLAGLAKVSRVILNESGVRFLMKYER